MDFIDLLLKYGLGAVALQQLWKLRDDMRAGFASVTAALEQQDDRLDDHESRIRTLEDGDEVAVIVVNNGDDN